METLLQWLSVNAANAHFIVFGLLVLAGFSLPISEEVMLVASAVLASSVIPDHTPHLFIAGLLGCYFSDWIAYWLGRTYGKKLYNISWLPFSLNEKRVEKLSTFYEKHGLLTLLVGRFIPFGVRNGIFMTAGISKMHFGKFAVIDAVGCLFFSLLIFVLAYSFGKNYESLCLLINQSNIIIFIFFMVFATSGFIYMWQKKKKVTAEKPVAEIEPIL